MKKKLLGNVYWVLEECKDEKKYIEIIKKNLAFANNNFKLEEVLCLFDAFKFNDDTSAASLSYMTSFGKVFEVSKSTKDCISDRTGNCKNFSAILEDLLDANDINNYVLIAYRVDEKSGHCVNVIEIEDELFVIDPQARNFIFRMEDYPQNVKALLSGSCPTGIVHSCMFIQQFMDYYSLIYKNRTSKMEYYKVKNLSTLMGFNYNDGEFISIKKDNSLTTHKKLDC